MHAAETRTQEYPLLNSRRQNLHAFLCIVLLAALSACDEAVEVTREYPSSLGQAAYLQGLPPIVPVHFDSIPDSAAGPARTKLQDIAAELSKGSPVRFAYGRIPDGRAFALRIALQPGPELTGLSLCQGKPIGRLDAPQRSRVVIAAICDDRRRLGEVRAIHTPTGSGPAVDDAAIIDAAVRKLFALPDSE